VAPLPIWRSETKIQMRCGSLIERAAQSDSRLYRNHYSAPILGIFCTTLLSQMLKPHHFSDLC